MQNLRLERMRQSGEIKAVALCHLEWMRSQFPWLADKIDELIEAIHPKEFHDIHPEE